MQPEDVDVVILSHVHWDHIGERGQFLKALFVMGSGSFKLLEKGVPNLQSHMHFEKNLLPFDRRIEVPLISGSDQGPGPRTNFPEVARELIGRTWKPLVHFQHAIDIFEDGSVYIINSAGHLAGLPKSPCKDCARTNGFTLVEMHVMT